jgi:hypothetical protein
MHVQSDAELSRLLGLSKAAVCRAKKRGMPTHDLQAARQWRDAHLNPLMRKDRNALKAASGYRSGAADPCALLHRVHALMDLAASALGTSTFEALREPLRQAMRDVPGEFRHQVLLSPEVMDALLGDLPALLATDPEPLAAGADPAAPPPEMSDEEAAAMGAFWYAMASKEPFPVDRLHG